MARRGSCDVLVKCELKSKHDSDSLIYTKRILGLKCRFLVQVHVKFGLRTRATF